MSATSRIDAHHWIYLLSYGLVFLIGLLLVQSAATLWVAVGASLIATSLAGWVLFLHSWLSMPKVNLLRVVQAFGFLNVFDARSSQIKPEYDRLLAKARSNIDIMGFGLRALREDYCTDFDTWATRTSVRILLLDPEFPTSDSSYAQQRDEEEHDDSGTIARDVHSFVTAVAPMLSNSKTSFNVRLYRCIPSVNIFRVDDKIFWGPYFLGQQSRKLPTFLVGRPGTLFDRLNGHFEAIWSSEKFSRAVPDSWLK